MPDVRFRGESGKHLLPASISEFDPIRIIIANPEVESCYSSGLPARNVPGRNLGNRQSDRWSNEAIYRRVAGPHRSTARLRVDNQYPSRIEARPRRSAVLSVRGTQYEYFLGGAS